MQQTKSRWSIYHPIKNFQHHELSDDELGLILATFTSEELHSLWFWKEGWGQWMSFVEVNKIEVVPEPERRKGSAPPLPKSAMKHLQSDDEQTEITQVFRDRALDRALVDRKYPRYDIQIPIDIIVNDRTYSTKTENISLGGICTIDLLPEWVAGYCTAILYPDQGEKIEVICSVVEDQTLENKQRLEIVATVQLDSLKFWLKEQGFVPEKK